MYGAHSFLKIVTKAKINPAINPIHIRLVFSFENVNKVVAKHFNINIRENYKDREINLILEAIRKLEKEFKI